MSLVGWTAHAPIFRDAWKRRLVVLILVIICAILALYPQRYRAVISLTPTNPGSLGLGGTLGQLGAVNTVFGSQAAVEISLKVANSPYVQEKVAQRLHLGKRFNMSEVHAERWLNRHIDVRTMRGGIIQVETTLRDAKLGKDLVAAYGVVIREQLAVIGRSQTEYKRQILVDLVAKANDRLTQAQSAYDSFRLRTGYSEPQSAIAAIGQRVPDLEAQIKAKELTLDTARKFATDGNLTVQRILASISALRGQLVDAQSKAAAAQGSLARVVHESTEVERLKRQLEVAQLLYENYKRFLEGTSVEDLTSTANIRILEPAFIDPERQYNLIPIGLGVLIFFVGLAVEFYNLRPPVGDPEPA